MLLDASLTILLRRRSLHPWASHLSKVLQLIVHLILVPHLAVVLNTGGVGLASHPTSLQEPMTQSGQLSLTRILVHQEEATVE